MPRPLALLVEAREAGALNLCRAFRDAGHEVTLVNRGPHRVEGDAETEDLARPSAVVDLYEGEWRRQGLFDVLNGAGHRMAEKGLGALAKGPLLASFDARLARPIQARVASVVQECGAEVVLSFWGIGQLPELRALQRARVPQALVHQFQTYPLTRAQLASPPPASPIEREVFGRLDARFHASAQMEEFVDRSLHPRRGMDIVLPEAWGSWASPRKRLPRLGERDGKRHVAHIGMPPSAPGTFDDVGPQLAALAREGLAVHAVEGFRAEGVQTFPRTGNRELLTGAFATFLTQFDALALLYNAPPGLAWFGGNHPARFLSGLSAGVPLAVPRGLFGAVQAFVQQQGNGFVYDSPADLAAHLRDEAALGRARKLAEALARDHVLERYLPRYQQALDRAVDLHGGKLPSAETTLK